MHSIQKGVDYEYDMKKNGDKKNGCTLLTVMLHRLSETETTSLGEGGGTTVILVRIDNFWH